MMRRIRPKFKPNLGPPKTAPGGGAPPPQSVQKTPDKGPGFKSSEGSTVSVPALSSGSPAPDKPSGLRSPRKAVHDGPRSPQLGLPRSPPPPRSPATPKSPPPPSRSPARPKSPARARSPMSSPKSPPPPRSPARARSPMSPPPHRSPARARSPVSLPRSPPPPRSPARPKSPARAKSPVSLPKSPARPKSPGRARSPLGPRSPAASPRTPLSLKIPGAQSPDPLRSPPLKSKTSAIKENSEVSDHAKASPAKVVSSTKPTVPAKPASDATSGGAGKAVKPVFRSARARFKPNLSVKRSEKPPEKPQAESMPGQSDLESSRSKTDLESRSSRSNVSLAGSGVTSLADSLPKSLDECDTSLLTKTPTIEEEPATPQQEHQAETEPEPEPDTQPHPEPQTQPVSQPPFLKQGEREGEEEPGGSEGKEVEEGGNEGVGSEPGSFVDGGDDDDTRSSSGYSVAEDGSVKKRTQRSRPVLPSTEKPADRTKMKMSDFIYWNPSRNHMQKTKKKHIFLTPKPTAAKDNSNKGGDDDEEEEEDAEVPVVQLKLDANGQIILNEESMTVSKKKSDVTHQPTEIIEEDEDRYVTSRSFNNKQQRAKRWSNTETERFFHALSLVGTDFTLMQNMFPSRSRRDLKNKFSKEDKRNRVLIDKALRERKEFDETHFEKAREAELAEEEQKKAMKEEKKKKQREKKKKEKKLAQELRDEQNLEEEDEQEDLEEEEEMQRKMKTEDEQERKENSRKRLRVKLTKDDGKFPAYKKKRSLAAGAGSAQSPQLNRHGEVVEILVNMSRGDGKVSPGSQACQTNMTTRQHHHRQQRIRYDVDNNSNSSDDAASNAAPTPSGSGTSLLDNSLTTSPFVPRVARPVRTSQPIPMSSQVEIDPEVSVTQWEVPDNDSPVNQMNSGSALNVGDLNPNSSILNISRLNTNSIVNVGELYPNSSILNMSRINTDSILNEGQLNTNSSDLTQIVVNDQTSATSSSSALGSEMVNMAVSLGLEVQNVSLPSIGVAGTAAPVHTTTLTPAAVATTSTAGAIGVGVVGTQQTQQLSVYDGANSDTLTDISALVAGIQNNVSSPVDVVLVEQQGQQQGWVHVYLVPHIPSQQGAGQQQQQVGVPQNSLPLQVGVPQNSLPLQVGVPQNSFSLQVGGQQNSLPLQVGGQQNSLPLQVGGPQNRLPLQVGGQQNSLPLQVGGQQNSLPLLVGGQQTGLSLQVGGPQNSLPSLQVGGQENRLPVLTMSTVPNTGTSPAQSLILSAEGGVGHSLLQTDSHTLPSSSSSCESTSAVGSEGSGLPRVARSLTSELISVSGGGSENSSMMKMESDSEGGRMEREVDRRLLIEDDDGSFLIVGEAHTAILPQVQAVHSTATATASTAGTGQGGVVMVRGQGEGSSYTQSHSQQLNVKDEVVLVGEHIVATGSQHRHVEYTAKYI